MAWFRHSGRPNTMRSFAYFTDSSMQYCAAPTPDAAWRMRFSCMNVLASARPSPSRPSIAVAGTRTSLSVTSAWSVGMLNVHHMKSTLKPGVSVGTMKQVMPLASPWSPDVRAKTMSWVALCRPLLKRFCR